MDDNEEIMHLVCCCCGAPTVGRQWWNRDTGFGLCPACVRHCKADVPAGAEHRDYGVRGYHFDLTPAGG